MLILLICRHDFLSSAARLNKIGPHDHVCSLLAVCLRDDPLCIMGEAHGLNNSDLVGYLKQRKLITKASLNEGHYSNLVDEDNNDEEEEEEIR